MSKLSHGLCSGKYSQKLKDIQPPTKIEEESKESDNFEEFYQEGIRPFMFKYHVGKDHVEFKTNQQQDAVEYLHHVLEFLEKDSKLLNKPNISNIF